MIYSMSRATPFLKARGKGVFPELRGDIQDDELRMDSEVPGYRYTAHHNIHVNRADNKCFTNAQFPAVVELVVSRSQTTFSPFYIFFPSKYACSETGQK